MARLRAVAEQKWAQRLLEWQRLGPRLEAMPIDTTRAVPGAEQIFSAASLLADQQEKHSGNYRQSNQNTDDQRNNRMSTGLEPLRPSTLLRCSDA